MNRKLTRQVMVGDVAIGGGAPISIQSMTNTDTRDVEATVKQIQALKEAGCEIVRCAIPDQEAGLAFGKIKKQVDIPLVADIHFDYRLALLALDMGADKIRINPGNIGKSSRLEEIIKKAKEKNVPIRVGVNSGSLEKDLLKKYGGVTAEALAESAINTVRLMEEKGFENLVVSLKASDVVLNYKAHMIVAESLNYPLHIGITEAGPVSTGKTKSALGIGALILAGIGDTLRVSLTGDPLEEIPLAKEILSLTGQRKSGIELISCPSCGRTEVDLIEIIGRVEERIKPLSEERIRNKARPLKVAVMGCEVNGPGEAAEADMGVAFGKKRAVVFQGGRIIGTYPPEEALNILFSMLS